MIERVHISTWVKLCSVKTNSNPYTRNCWNQPMCV